MNSNKYWEKNVERDGVDSKGMEVDARLESITL